MKNVHLKIRNISGFTLAEVMIAMAINLVILGIVWTIFIRQNYNLGVQDDIVRMQQATRLAMTAIAKDVRLAGYNENLSQATFDGFVATTNATTLTLRRYEGAKWIQTVYAQNGPNVLRTITTTPASTTRQQIFPNITLQLAYKDRTGATPTPLPLTNIRTVEVTMTGKTLRPDREYTLNSGYRTYTLTASITSRNAQD